MKIIDAKWEERNLGLKTIEIEFDSLDFVCNIDLMANTIKNVESFYQYSVIKIPVNQIEANMLLQECGYTFHETQFTIKKKLSEVTESTFPNYIGNVSLELIQEKQRILKNIDNDMFETDRISLDKTFGREIANKRYRNWINDLSSETHLIYVLVDKTVDVGFFVVSANSSKIANIPLGGIYSDHKKKGYGIDLVYLPMIISKQLNCIFSQTKVSSNNKPILDIYMHFGYSIKNIHYVFTKIIPEACF